MGIQIKLVQSLSEVEIAKLTEILKESLENSEAISVDKDQINTYYQNINKELKDRKKILVTASDNNIIVASIIARFYSADHVQHLTIFEKLLVKKEFRRQHIATQLIQQLEMEVKKLAKERIELSFRQGNPAEKVYLRQGFKIWGIATKESKIGDKYFDEVYMEKLLI